MFSTRFKVSDEILTQMLLELQQFSAMPTTTLWRRTLSYLPTWLCPDTAPCHSLREQSSVLPLGFLWGAVASILHYPELLPVLETTPHSTGWDNPSLHPVAVLSLMHPRVQLALCLTLSLSGHSANWDSNCANQNPLDPFPWGCSPAS